MKKLKVDLEIIANAMEDVARVDMEYYLDKETGEVIFILEEVSRYVEEEDENLREDLPDWQKEDVKLAQEILFKNPDRYICIPEGPPCNGYDLMVEFAEKVEDELLREKLSIASDGKGAFRPPSGMPLKRTESAFKRTSIFEKSAITTFFLAFFDLPQTL